MRHLLTTLLLGFCAISMSAQSPALTTYMAADACGDEARSQYFIMVVDANQAYNFTQAPPQVQSYCPTGGTAKSITAYTSNTAQVATLNTKTNGCAKPVFYDLFSFAGALDPGSRLMLFTSPNPDLSAIPAGTFADLCGTRVYVAFGNYTGNRPFFYNNNPYDSSCGAYSLADFVIGGIKQTVQYKPNNLQAADGAYIGINNGNLRYGMVSNCSCPGLSCATPPNISFSGVLSICEGKSTTITANAGAGFNYRWNNGATTSSITVGPEMTTTYQVTVSNPSTPQCQSVGSVSVSVFNFPTIPITTMGETGGPACFGEKLYLRTGSAQPITTPFTYQWTPPNPSIVIAPDESVIISEKTAGIYKITYNYNNGCSTTDQLEATYAVPAPVRVCTNAPVCTGETVNLQVSSPGVGYRWTGPSGYEALGASQTLAAPVAGTYTVIVSDENGCTTTGSTTVIINNCMPAILTATVSAVNTSCGFGNGSATAGAISGTAPYTYNWSNTTATNDPMTQTNLSSGTYTVTVTDATGTTATSTAVIAGSSSPSPTLAATATSCGNFNGAIDLSISYGTAPFSFNWNDISTAPEPQNRTALSSGTYSVTITDAAGCTNTSSATVAASVGANITAAVTNISCTGANNGAINLTAGGGSAPYSFNWADITTTPEPEDRTNLVSGTYSVTVTAANSCTATFSATILQPSPLSLSAVAVNANCGTTNGSITLTSGGGTGTLNYDWSDLAGANNPKDRTNLNAGTYTVIMADANGCSTTLTRIITQSGTPVASATTTNVACFGINTGAINLTVTGGALPYSYNWADISTTPEPEDRSALAGGNYAVTITDASNCTQTATYNITQPAAALAESITTTNASCGASNGTITLNVTGGTLPYSFNWADITIQPEPQHRTGLGAGTYSVTVTDANGCVRTATATIVPNGLPALTAAVTNANCGGATGAINLTVTGGVSPYTYNWADIITTPEPEDRTALTAGTYSVTVTSSNGCTGTSSWTITNVGQVNISMTTTVPTCGLHNGTATAQAYGGAPPYSYDWQHIAGTSNSNAVTDLAPLESIYYLTVTNGNGCTASSVVGLTPTSTQVTFNSSQTNTTCNLPNGTITLNVTSTEGPYTFDWAHIPGVVNPQNLTNITSGSYYVTITSVYGCTATTVFTIPPTTAVSIANTITNATCGSNNGAVTLTATGGASYLYDWAHISGTSNPKNISNLSAGTYTVTVTALSTGCTASKSSTVTQLGGAISNITATITNSTGGAANGSIAITGVVGGIAPFNYDWINISGTNNPATNSSLVPGIYTVTVTGTYGCTKNKSFTVISSNLPNPDNNSELINTQNIDDGTENTSTSEIITYPQDNLVKVYPNPATTAFTIAIPESLGKCQIQIFDASSRLVQQLEGSVTVEVRVDNWSSGVYSIKIMPDNQPDTVPIAVNVVVRGY
jgi:Secretion system C-terminal sorting domain/SprB repeat